MINRRFSVIKKLGEGRSAVYLCEDTEQDHKYIALKVLPNNSSNDEEQIFRKEFQTIQNLDHPNIIQAYERGTVVEISEIENITPGSEYLSIEYFDGKELLDYAIDDEDCLKEIIVQISSVLFYLHQSNCIYYDLKPENILVKEVNGKPFIKLIDLGFAKKRDGNNNTVMGTAEYIAPEILKKEQHDHRVDLYSFGMLLYRLIFKKFPFASRDHLEIYKEQIEREFEFPLSKFSPKLIDVVKKLLMKNPEERYFNSLQILIDLNIPVDEQMYENWIPVKVFSDRTDILNIVNRYVSVHSEGEIITIRGYEKSGKSSVARELYSRYENFILINNDRTKSGIRLFKFFLKKILFNKFTFQKITADTLGIADKIFSDSSEDVISDVKSILNKVTKQAKFTLLFDDFNLYDKFTLEIFKEIFPIFQVNGCTVILTEKSDADYVTGYISNLVELNLTSFTTVQTEELLEKTYADFFPLPEIKQLVMHHADFLPGNIIEFLKDIVVLKIIKFEYDGIKVISDENSNKILSNLFHEIFSIRYRSLTDEEIKVASFLSAFELVPDKNQLMLLANCSESAFTKTIGELQHKHVLISQSGYTFTSDGMKNYIYSQIPQKKKHHEVIAQSIKKNFPQFNRIELARHFEIYENYDESYFLLTQEAEEAEKIAALKYEQDILEKMLKLPADKKKYTGTKLKLCSIYHSTNNYKNANDLAEELLNEDLSKNDQINLKVIKGNSLIRLGSAEDGKKELKSLLPAIHDSNEKIKLQLDIAWGELETNNYDEAAAIVNDVVNNPDAKAEYKGDANNLLGLVSFHQKNDLHKALEYFEKCLNEYSKAELPHRIAGIEINIGNICNMIGEYEKVEKHWNSSLEISTSLGNLYYQAQVLMNFGIYHFNKQSFEDSIKNYKRAALIFNALSDRVSYARCEINLGEVYLFNCEYLNAIKSLQNARDVLQQLQNQLEESEALFLLGKIYSVIGDNYNFNKTLEDLKRIYKSESANERIKIHLAFLESMNAFEHDQAIDAEELHLAAGNYYSQEERINYFDALTLLIDNHLKNGEPNKVSVLLSDKNFVEVCTSNVYLEAERLLLLGKTAAADPESYSESPISFFNKAYDLVSDLNIRETTCKIIFELSKYYLERGNILKAKEFASYGKSIINFMSDQFEDENSKDMYLKSTYRQDAFDILCKIADME